MPVVSAHPLNLLLRFLLEIAALVALGAYGWHVGGHGVVGFVLAVLFPLIAASVWGIFATPGEQVRNPNAPVPTPGPIRLVIELVVLWAGVAATYAVGAHTLAAVFAILLVINLATSYDRIAWLLSH